MFSKKRIEELESKLFDQAEEIEELRIIVSSTMAEHSKDVRAELSKIRDAFEEYKVEREEEDLALVQASVTESKREYEREPGDPDHELLVVDEIIKGETIRSGEDKHYAPRVFRMRVENGWIYIAHLSAPSFKDHLSMIFVPND